MTFFGDICKPACEATQGTHISFRFACAYEHVHLSFSYVVMPHIICEVKTWLRVTLIILLKTILSDPEYLV